MKTKIKKNNISGSNKTIEELHTTSKTWISEINFIDYEIQFLKHLLGSKYIDCLDAGLYERIEEFTKEIFNKKVDCTHLKELCINHEMDLLNLIEQHKKTDNTLILTHTNLALKINKFISSYKYLKMQVFEIVESTLQKKAQKKLT